jgi:Fic family protein
MPISPDYRQKLLTVSLRRGALATTAIEGNTLSEKDLDRIEAGEDLPPSKRYLQQEVQNVINALNLLLKELIQDGRPQVIKPTLIQRFHRLVSDGLGDGYGQPGCFRRKNVIVGNYRPPSFEQVDDLIKRFCGWLSSEFHYTGGQHFDETLLQAIVSHVYIVWIHPFLDGNGRTARLLEFYLLLRAGVPDIASLILSNHYNNTRDDYYRQIQKATETEDLTEFILYALEGFRDGLEHDVLKVIHDDQIDTIWKNYVHDTTGALQIAKKKNEKIIRRIRQLAYYLPPGKFLTINQIITADVRINQVYGRLSRPTLKSDLDILVKCNLFIEKEGKYRNNQDILRNFIPGTSTGITKHF